MDRIVYCFVAQHDWRLTLAAAVICLCGVGAAFGFLAQARTLKGGARRRSAGLAVLIGSLSIWCTHFVAMQGYAFTVPIAYDVLGTILSMLAPLAALGVAVPLVLSGDSRPWRALGAAVGFFGVVAMHFVGVWALRLPGVISWDPLILIQGLTTGLGLSVLGAGLVFGRTPLRIAATSAFGAASIVVLHYVAMAAMTLAPDPSIAVPPAALSENVVRLVVIVLVACVAAGVALFTWTRYASRHGALRQLREAIDAMPDGLGFYDEHDRLVLWNARYAEVNPELASNLKVGMTFRDILHIGLDEGLYAEAEGRADAWVEERLTARAGLSNTMEQHIVGDRWLRIQDRRTAEGGIVTVVNDITDLKRDARALAEARDAAEAANTAKSQFLANMSHEIRTPLNGVIGLAQALAATDLSPAQREMLDLIHSSGHTLQTLLSDILDLARVESGRMELTEEPFDVGRAVRESAQLYAAIAHEKGLGFFAEVAPEIDGWVQGDVVRLKQILTNLVSNAVKFTGAGFVSLSAAAGPDRDGRPTLRFTVEDTGIGFDCDTRARLFGRFEQADGAITRKFGGSGLGLAISRQLAVMMGGDLDCESEPGGGSAFILTVPFAPAEAPAAATQTVAGPEDADGRRTRVLLADDHPTNRKVVELILGQAAVDLISVEDGAQALEAFRAGEFDLVLMDMQMPVMDGLTATREIRLHEAVMGRERTPLVMLTANALAEHIAAGEAAGADRHLAKPFDAATLLALVADPPRAEAQTRAA